MLNIIIFGAPGSGKGTQGKMVNEIFGLDHISTGEILRSEIDEGTELGKIADKYMSKGKLVPDEIAIGVLEHVITAHPESKGFIFDGFPRTIPQGKALEKMLASHSEEISLVFSLEVDDEKLIERLLNRGKMFGRADDNRETIESRLKVYYEQTAPLKEFYEKQGKLRKIEGNAPISEIAESIKNEIEEVIKKNVWNKFC